MKLVKLNDTEKFVNSENCFGRNYPLDESTMNLAVIKITGRYPDDNFVVNEVSKEMCYILSGEGKVVKKGGEILEFEAGDMVFLDKNESYYFNGQCEMAVICAPKWAEEQHKEVE
ncbi:cupin domain-containing protein [Candidatus Saccharibacteria bacterium]|nr:cupin domain-containing protein [Candidatus Saccharibacteria bacterium]